MVRIKVSPKVSLKVSPSEGNTFSLRQVMDILDGKRVVIPFREIQEVMKAIATNNLVPTLDSFSVKDFLKAHGKMMVSLVSGLEISALAVSVSSLGAGHK